MEKEALKLPSPAKQAFEANKTDVKRLLEIHTNIGGVGQGRRRGVQCLNKSAIVLTSAVWEAYVEDLCGNAVDHMAQHIPDASGLPDLIKAEIASEIHRIYNDGPNHTKDRLAAWVLADAGWKTALANNLARIKNKLYVGDALNTCKAKNVKHLFSQSIGLADVTLSWHWQGTNPATNIARLDNYIVLRGDIAHRGEAATSVKRNQCTGFLSLVEHLVDASEAAVSQHMLIKTGVAL